MTGDGGDVCPRLGDVIDSDSLMSSRFFFNLKLDQGAASLQGNDPLATLLFQIASPAHIPWADTRWQELLHGYDVWVHMEDSDGTGILSQACQSMAKHAAVSSNDPVNRALF